MASGVMFQIRTHEQPKNEAQEQPWKPGWHAAPQVVSVESITRQWR